MRCLKKLEDDFENAQKEVGFIRSRIGILYEAKKQHLDIVSKTVQDIDDCSWRAAEAVADALRSEMRSSEVMTGFLGSMAGLLLSLEKEISQGLAAFKSSIKPFEDGDQVLMARMEGVASKDPVVRQYTIQGHLNKRYAHARENKELLETCLENGIGCVNRVRDALWAEAQRLSAHRRRLLKSESSECKLFSEPDERLCLQSFKSMLYDEMRSSPVGRTSGNVLYRECVEVQSGFSGWRSNQLVVLGQRILLVETGKEQSIEDILAEGRAIECSVASVSISRAGSKQIKVVLRNQGFFSALLGLNSLALRFRSSTSLLSFAEALGPAGSSVKTGGL